MPYIKTLRKFLVTLSTASLLYSTNSHSHPHNWIDLSTEFSVNAEGELTDFTQYWQFDQFFSMISYADLMNEYNDESLGLGATALKMVANVGPDQYLSSLEIGGVDVPLPVPNAYSLDLKEIDSAQILVLKMKFVLPNKPSVKGKTVILQTYEPTYFIAMNYLSNDNIRINSASLECKSTLIKPNPSDELIDYANSLDRSIRDTDGLGDDFAERVEIKC